MNLFLIDGPDDASRTFVFTHGAGGGMRTPFMNAVARGVSEAGIRVVRFEFPYVVARRRRPDPQSVLLATWREVVGELGGGAGLVIGGKSLGGRMASMVADELRVRGLICLGYPFHPPGRPERLRTAHLEGLQTPALIVLGTRDAFGTRAEVEGYKLSPAIRIEWIEGGDHSFRNRQHVAKAISESVTFVTAP